MPAVRRGNSIRVLHVIPSVDSVDGGPSVVIFWMTAALRQIGVSVKVATTSLSGSIQHHLRLRADEIDGIESFPRQVNFYKISLPLLPWLWLNVRRFDVVHVHALFSFAPVTAAAIAWLRGVPFVIRPLGVLNTYGVEGRRPWLKRLSIRFIEGPLLRRAAAVHFTAEAECKEATSLGIQMQSQIIPLGVPANEPGSPDRILEAHPELIGRKVILFLSRIDPKKNLESLLDAMSQLGPTLECSMLLVCGSGHQDYVASLQSRARTLGISGRVAWAGEVAGDLKASALAAADIFVLPSNSENFGIAVVEAMAAKLPVIVSTGVPLHEQIAENCAGWITGTDSKSIRLALESALLDPIEMKARGLRAMALVEGRYTLRAMAEQLAALYSQITNVAESDVPGVSH